MDPSDDEAMDDMRPGQGTLNAASAWTIEKVRVCSISSFPLQGVAACLPHARRADCRSLSALCSSANQHRTGS